MIRAGMYRVSNSLVSRDTDEPFSMAYTVERNVCPWLSQVNSDGKIDLDLQFQIFLFLFALYLIHHEDRTIGRNLIVLLKNGKEIF